MNRTSLQSQDVYGIPLNSFMISPMANQSIFSKTNAFHNKDDYLLKNKVFQKNADRRDAFREIVQDYPQMKNSIELNIK